MDPSLRLLDIGERVDFAVLRSAIEWAQRSVTVYGEVHPQPRLTRWYGDVGYCYSGLEWEPATMPDVVAAIRDRAQALTGFPLNSVLCNLYRSGSDCVGWHADDEPIFGGDPVVVSVSFGATRAFKMRRNDRSGSRDFDLRAGSVLVMGTGVQTAWQHCVPRTARSCGERINLTFRQVLRAA